ncbi:cytochrome ubiquinol oxidase subunit 1 [Lucifera butyrica]|uniref:Cytochrome ubiquinol oxidase subunit 1 n=1 Tax=Lucifera butyrica TaxID=1351585 RepID=A0A498R2H8_9FIRM|nr:cytochrome ubiquinol oxidase subunit I [Lucifera butyrica]VBB05017.1 cytochrome ubiquinol oxidase subunit 1 [Lucifera butyrica]
MGEVLLARWQFGITSVYHFLFVPLTLGLSVLVAVMETLYVRTGNEKYKEMTKFWGHLFLINFAMGVVTGIVQEFHFGMNWSEYSRFMGDIFGAPLALEALTAFFLESTFLGLWVFGWDKLPGKLHAACIWIVAFASNLSAFWILVANSFMQSPVGYTLHNGRAEMTSFLALITNKYVMFQFPHTVLSGLVTAGIFIMAVSAYYLLRHSQAELFRSSFRIGVSCALIAVLLSTLSGHLQTQFIIKAQPMKIAAAEALWNTADPAPFAVAAVIDEKHQQNTAELEIPGLLSLLAHDSLHGKVMGIKDLESEYTAKYGPGNYVPPVTPVFWSFRLMVLAGMWMVVLCALSAYLLARKKLEQHRWILKAALYSLPVPYIANSCGWFMAEAGRQPWIVFGLQKVSQAASPNVSALNIWTSLTGFTLIYGILAVVAVYLMKKHVQTVAAGPGPVPAKPAKEATLWS